MIAQSRGARRDPWVAHPSRPAAAALARGRLADGKGDPATAAPAVTDGEQPLARLSNLAAVLARLAKGVYEEPIAADEEARHRRRAVDADPRVWRDAIRDRLAVLGSGRMIVRVFAGLFLLLLLYYIVGAIWVNRIDDDPSFVPAAEVPPGGSRAVAMAAALIEREVDHHPWTANDPFFLPGGLLDNMPNYQQGIIYALSRFGNALTEQLARSRGTSAVDPDADRAAGLLRYPGDVWLFNFDTSLAPTASAESQYRVAYRALRAYDQRVADGAATFERRADNLMVTLDRFANDLGSASAVIDQHLRDNAGFPFSFTADDIFYQTKGRLYAYFMLLKALGQDFEQVLNERNLGTVWTQMLQSAQDAAEQRPWVVLNGGTSSQFVPSHLASQGFLLLRLRTQLREVENVLQK